MSKREIINELDKPIFIIGNVRSGTTILSDLLSHHKDVALWLEPKYIWRYGKAGAKHDLRKASEATNKVKNYIRKRFYNYLKDSGKSRFMEKTPSNVFRVSFIHEIFPNGKFLHIVRNGRDSSLSAEKKWTNKPDSSVFKRRLTSKEIPIDEIPHYTFAALRDVFGRTLFPKRRFIWGQQFEGIQEYRQKHTVIETCAKQWVEGTRISNQELALIPEAQKCMIRYEDISDDLDSQLRRVLDFLELDHDKAFFEYASKTVYHTKDRNYSGKDREKIQLIEPIIKEQMEHLGYK